MRSVPELHRTEACRSVEGQTESSNNEKRYTTFCLRNYYLYKSTIQQKHIMDIPALKLDLVQKILSTKNPSLLVKINKLLQKEVEKDWWDQLPREVQDSIFEGIHDIEKGKVFTHEQVIQEAKQKYGF
jgi:hypothetical protein